MQEIRWCLTANPSGVEVVDLLLPRLVQMGRRKEADELYDKVAAALTKQLADYPKDSLALNNYAWLCAQGRRNLEEGLKHGRKAIDFAPENANFIDTYAELCFQNGDRTKALELMRQCIERDPRQPYFRDQLKRIEKGDASAALPQTLWRN
jgi:tetratricopeptide (TPR) repeat protein